MVKLSLRFRAATGRNKSRPLRCGISAVRLDQIVHWIASEESAIEEIQNPKDIHAVGHRIVHGVELFSESVVITDAVLKGIQDASI